MREERRGPDREGFDVASPSPARRVVAASSLAFVVASIAWALAALLLFVAYDGVWTSVPLWVADMSAVAAFPVYACLVERWLRRYTRGVPTWALLPILAGPPIAALDLVLLIILIVAGSTGPVPPESVPILRLAAMVFGSPICLVIGVLVAFRRGRRA